MASRTRRGKADRGLLERAIEVFDDRNKALDWIFEPNSAQDGRTPQQISSDQAGREQVFKILGRIEHGVIS
jgi:uncharacterized protein (DUF2384 family)